AYPLLFHLNATVARASLFGGAGIYWPFFTVADHFHLVCGNALHLQVTFYSLRAAFAKRKVVFAGALFRSMAFEAHATVRIGFQVVCMNNQRITCFGVQFGLVELEVERSDGTQTIIF